MRTLTKAMRDSLTPVAAIEVLRKGNERFVNNLKSNRNLLQQVNETSDGQHPLAIILSCIDSRTSAELIFDQGLGDVFSCRVAGNVLNDDILGSMEFACKVAGAKAIVVLGHSRCGAIKGACDGVKLGNLTTLLQKIDAAIALETETFTDRDSNNPAFVERVAELNVLLVKRQVMERSPLLAQMVASSEIAIVGGMYDVESGAVDFYDSRMLMGAA
ncbi:MAG: carbonic anhydrase [Gemmatimonadetes bacterium]|nr:carbonic anhydrase [Gemmatimonadota bacterium]